PTSRRADDGPADRRIDHRGADRSAASGGEKRYTFLRGVCPRRLGAQSRKQVGASMTANGTAAAVHPARKAKSRALYHMWCENFRGPGRAPELYALLDAARDPAIYRRLQGFAATEQIACLYQGAAAEDLGHAAPWLVRLGPRTDVFDWIWD